MNLNQVQVFCAVAKHLSYSMAAEELFITQPAVSQQVKALERQLNVKLFERVGNKLFLTEAGEAVLTHAQAMLTARAEMEQTLAMLRGSGRGRLASAPTPPAGCTSPRPSSGPSRCRPRSRPRSRSRRRPGS